MKRLPAISLISLCVALAGCARSDTRQNDLISPPRAQDPIAGFWKQDESKRKRAENELAPRIMRFQINENGFRQIDFCQLGSPGTSSGTFGYKLDNGSLEFEYIAVRKSDQPQEFPIDVRTFKAPFRLIDSNTLELDGRLTYVRFTPEKNAPVNESADGLCRLR